VPQEIGDVGGEAGEALGTAAYFGKKPGQSKPHHIQLQLLSPTSCHLYLYLYTVFIQ
jgi:hypothetical protein